VSVETKVNYWIQDAYERGASDIHFEPDKNDKMRVRMRVDGMLRTVETSPDSRKILSRLKVMAELDVNEKVIPQDGRINFEKHAGTCAGLDLRMSTLPCMDGEKVVLRLIDNRKLGMQMDELGFSKRMQACYEPLVNSPNGLVLHVGPTGSGKTTSLYAVLQTLKKKEINIQTAEDPVEYNMFGVTQTAVNHELGLTFPKVLRALLRQDPDVILVGEIRDSETADIALEAAMTGHLVLSTLHTNDAVGTVVRLLDMGIAPFCIAYSLRCVVSQRFVRRLCEKCRRATQPPPRVAQVTGSNKPIHQAVGCGSCGKSGYRGRIPLFEFMPNSGQLKKAVYGSVTPDGLAQVAAQSGLISLWDDGLEKVWRGQTSLEEVLRVVKGVRSSKASAKAKAQASAQSKTKPRAETGPGAGTSAGTGGRSRGPQGSAGRR